MKFSVTLIALLHSLLFLSQENAKTISISGKIKDKKGGTALEFATVTFQNLSDKKIITGAITDDKGKYTVNSIPGIYSMKVDFIGLKSYVADSMRFTGNTVLPDLLLEEDAKLLEAVDVAVEKTTIEHKLDKKIFNVGNDLVSKGSSASDLLNNVPSVNVNASGVVSLRGNSGVRVLINGKPSVLTANNGLEQIPAESIEKVEVITNPSARYDSQGTAGIINIILKKNKKGGFSSSLQATSGIPSNHALGYNASYKHNKINLFTDLRYRYIDFLAKESNLRTIYSSGTIDSYLAGSTKRLRNNRTFTIYFGGDYYFNDKNTLTLSYYHRNNVSRNTVDYTFNYLDRYKNQQRLITATENYREPQKSNQIELNYLKTYSTEGQKLTFNLQYDFWNDDENESITEQETLPVALAVKKLRSRDIESSKDFLFQTDYIHPFGKTSRLEAGSKGEIRQINSDYNVYDNDTPVDSLNNVLRYEEQIIGAYLQYGQSFKKFQYLLGVRVEDSKTGSKDDLGLFNIRKKYTNFFPTAHLTYNVSTALNFQLSYSRRIDRPSFWHLNPFGGIADRRNIRVGNPDMNPVYTDSYELGTLIRWKKFSVNPGFYYQFSKNIFEDLRTADANGFLVTKVINSGTEDRMGAEISVNYSPLKWLTVSGEANYFRFEQRGIFNVTGNALTSRLSTRAKFPSWNFQTNFNYIGGRKTGQLNEQAQYWFDIGMGKDLFKETATITVKADNLFNSRTIKGVASGPDYTLTYTMQNIGPRVYATFTYRLNRKKNEKDRLPD